MDIVKWTRKLEIICHNVNGYKNRFFEVYNTYFKIDPDIIIIMEHQ